MKTEEKINQILEETFRVSKENTLQNLGMDDVNSWDSLSHMNLIVTIEETFGIELSGDDIADMISFDAIKNTVSKYI